MAKDHRLRQTGCGIDPEKEETEGATIGRIIVDLLKGAGFSVDWPGTFDKRIEITAIDWKRR